MLGLTRAPASFDLSGGSENGWKLPSGNQHQYFYVYDNPYWTAYENPSTDDVDRIIGNFDVLYNANSWLTIAYKLGVDQYTDARKSVFAIHSWDPPNPTGQIEHFTNRSRQIYSDLIATATKSFSDKMNGRLSIGNNLNDRRSEDLYLRGRNLDVPEFYNLRNASDRFAGQVSETIRTASLFFTGDIDFDNTYYVTVGGRNDWASTFGANKNNFFYPSVNAAIVFSELLPEGSSLSKHLSFGKLRLGYAQTGIEPPAYSSTTYYTNQTMSDGFTDGISFPFLGTNGFGYSNGLGNVDLKPERQIGTEFGLDLRFFKGRLNVDFTYYNQKSVDILMLRPLAPSSGFEAIYTNAGEMVNKGIELSIGGTPVSTEKGFEWAINANFTKNTNEVLKLETGVDEINIETAFGSIGSYAIVGDPYGAMFGTKWLRNEGGDLVINPSTGLPLLDPERGNVGNPFPDFLLNIRNSFTYKGVTLSALLDIREGGDIWCGTCARLTRLGRSEESADREKTYIIEGVLADANGEATSTPNNVEVDARTYFERYLGDNGAAVEQSVFDGSWTRLRELTVGYDFSLGPDSKIVKTLNVYFTGRNLWLSTDYPGVDPETSLTGSGSNNTGFDYFNNPGTKSFIFGLKAGF
jgi:outer membrane receptor protein involved in Fe transport